MFHCWTSRQPNNHSLTYRRAARLVRGAGESTMLQPLRAADRFVTDPDVDATCSLEASAQEPSVDADALVGCKAGGAERSHGGSSGDPSNDGKVGRRAVSAMGLMASGGRTKLGLFGLGAPAAAPGAKATAMQHPLSSLPNKVFTAFELRFSPAQRLLCCTS
jgi:hypothetical protein